MIKTKKLENELVRELKQKILFRYKNIYTNRKPAASPKYRNHIKNELGYIPILQPEIDMILETYNNELFAVEVKLFRTEEINYNLPFYHGLGQTLALYRYGFDKVALFHLFLGDSALKKINEYGPEIWSFIRNDIKIPVDFSYIWVENKSEGHDFHVMQYTSRKSGYKLSLINDKNFTITFKHKNPIRNLPVQNIMRECMELWLKDKLKSV